MDTKLKSFHRTGDIIAFLDKSFVAFIIERYDREKAAQNLASKLEGLAFDVCLRLLTAHRKMVHKIQSELQKKFKRKQ